MDNHKTDELIRKKINELKILPGNDRLDKQSSWERMHLRLNKPSYIKQHWWKYAAALLILMMGGYESLHLNQKTIKTPEKAGYSANNERMREGIKPSQVTKNEDQSPASSIKKTYAKKVSQNRIKEKIPVVAHPAGASQNVVIARSEERATKQSQVSMRRLLLPPQRTNPSKRNRNDVATFWDAPYSAPKSNIVNKGAKLFSENKNDSTSVNNYHLYANKMENKRMATPAPKTVSIVYYNEIEQTGNTPTSPSKTNKKLQIRLNVINKNAITLLATQQSFTDGIKINLSPKN